MSLVTTAIQHIQHGLQGVPDHLFEQPAFAAKAIANHRHVPEAEKAAIAERLKAVVWPLVAAHHVRPVIHRTFDLLQAAQAHRAMEEGAYVGKIVLTSNTLLP